MHCGHEDESNENEECSAGGTAGLGLRHAPRNQGKHVKEFTSNDQEVSYGHDSLNVLYLCKLGRYELQTWMRHKLRQRGRCRYAQRPCMLTCMGLQLQHAATQLSAFPYIYSGDTSTIIWSWPWIGVEGLDSVNDTLKNVADADMSRHGACARPFGTHGGLIAMHRANVVLPVCMRVNFNSHCPEHRNACGARYIPGVI